MTTPKKPMDVEKLKESDRAMFEEAFWKSNGHRWIATGDTRERCFDSKHHDDDDYFFISVQSAWEGWQLRATSPLEARIAQQNIEIEVLKTALSNAIEDLQWMSGSGDFAKEGVAGLGWRSVRQRIDDIYQPALASRSTEGGEA